MNPSVAVGVFFLLSFSITTPVNSCSCVPGSFDIPRDRVISRDFCNPNGVYIGTVVGAICNCIPVGGEERIGTDCQDFQLQANNVVSTEVIERGNCSSGEVLQTSAFFRNCTALGTRNGVVSGGLTVEGPSDANLTEFINTTDSRGMCGLSCPFNRDGDESEFSIDDIIFDEEHLDHQPCLYRIRIDEVFRANFNVSDVIVTTGPDVLTSCGDPNRVVQINKQYVVGIGGACSPIDEWQERGTYSSQEIEQLRELREQFEAGEIECGAQHLLPSFVLTLLALLLTLNY